MRTRWTWSCGAVMACSIMAGSTQAMDAGPEQDPMRDLVAVSIVGEGRAIVMATSGLPTRGHTWRFRSFDTSELPQPIRTVSLSASGTKLFIQPGDGPGGVLDLTRQYRHHAPLQYVAMNDLAIDGRGPAEHRLPGERFVVPVGTNTLVVDDMGRLLSSAPAAAVVPGMPDTSAPALTRSRISLRAVLTRFGWSLPEERIAAEVRSLVKESADTAAAQGAPLADWTFFRVSVDKALYAPVLELARLETVFPSAFDALEHVAQGMSARQAGPLTDRLYDRYLRMGTAAHRAACNFYVTTHSLPGSWLIEYWLYYPFDVGGLGSHPHDPEHIFVEVDKLGGDVRRIIGAGHGYLAGNNMFTAGRAGTQPIRLPLFAIVELGKHASAPDIDRDGVFTPGIDENTYNERAKVWGVRDVIGTMDNELLAYDTTMSSPRRPAEFLAAAASAERFPDDPDVVAAASCQLTELPGVAADRRLRLSDWILLPPCDGLSSDCGRLHVTAHPDFLDPKTILKEWNFPSAFLRTTYGLGPRRGLHSIGLGYAMDMEGIPGLNRAVPLPGQLGADVFYWHQPVSTATSGPPARPDDRDSCPGRVLVGGAPYCPDGQGVGWGVRYEQFLSNLFGIYSSVRVFSPPLGDAWIAFGPFIEVPLGRRSNAMILGGLAFRPYESPRFELKVSVGLWKPKTNHLGIPAASDIGR